MTTTRNTCLRCQSNAYADALAGMAEIMVDDDDAHDMDTAEHLIRMSRDRSIAVIEQTEEMLTNTNCEDWH